MSVPLSRISRTSKFFQFFAKIFIWRTDANMKKNIHKVRDLELS